MYRWIWNRLVGSTIGKLVQVFGFVAAMVALLFTWVFPWVADNLLLEGSTLGP